MNQTIEKTDIKQIINMIKDSSQVVDERFEKNIEIGQVVRQGDIYIHRVADDHPHGPQTNSSQLAFGNTKGSRHIAEGDSVCYEGTTLPSYAKPKTFLGPLVKCKTRFPIPHPEHANYSLPAGTYQITHQMDARTLKRVND